MSECKAYVTKAPEGGIEYRSVNITGEEGNVSLKPVLTGICGTDRGIVRGALPFSYDPSNYDYLVIGHESMCEVVESSSSEFSPGVSSSIFLEKTFPSNTTLSVIAI